MTAADQIKSLIKSFGEGNEEHFFASAMQIAATEARQGHTTFAQELKTLIEKAKKIGRFHFLNKEKLYLFLLPKENYMNSSMSFSLRFS